MTTCSHKVEMGVDVETFSGVDIKNGAYAYANAPDFEIVLVAYKIGDGEVKQFIPGRFAGRPGVMSGVGMDGEQLSFMGEEPFELDGSEEEFLAALTDPEIIKTAYNANFERTTLSRYYDVKCNPDEWRCTAVLATTLGLPRSLDDAGQALGLPEDKLKLKTGRALIQYFCKYVKPTNSNGGRNRNYPRHDLAKWRLFCEYNKQDVVTEQAILEILKPYRPIEKEQRLWSVDQNICDRGIRIDVPFVEGIVEYDKIRTSRLMEEARELTGLENPNSPAQLKAWFSEQGAPLLGNDISKGTVKDALRPGSTYYNNPKIRRALELRQALGKSSVKKYQAMLSSVCDDGRVRGMLQFYGANRTGRWAGRIVQLQNLPQNHIEDLDLARRTVADRDFDLLEMMYGEPAQVFSELVRTAFIPSECCRFIVTDFSAIEARVIAWMAQEEWRLEVFEHGGDIYCASASQMFHVPVVKHGENGHLRQRGKVAELALGYGGGVGAMVQMDTTHTIPENEMQGIVNSWREASPRIVALWRDVEKRIKITIKTKKPHKLPIVGDIAIIFSYEKGNLFAQLPSGRKICYWGAKPIEGRFGEELEYWGVSQEKKLWAPVRTYGGKLVENLVQATARDCLAEKMVKVESMGYKVVAHVHDEMILDVPRADKEAFKIIDDLMAEPIDWAPGLPLKGGTYECDYYQKD